MKTPGSFFEFNEVEETQVKTLEVSDLNDTPHSGLGVERSILRCVSCVSRQEHAIHMSQPQPFPSSQVA